jgi:membrane-associated phospholipid phosphatase
MKILIITSLFLGLSFSQSKYLLQRESNQSFNNTWDNISGNIKNDFLSVFKVGKGFMESPFNLSSEDYILAGIIAGTTALSFNIDNYVRNSVKKFHNTSMDRITDVGEKFGKGKYAPILSGLFYVGGLITEDKEIRKTGLILIETIALNALVTQGLKMTFGRARPYINEGNLDIDFMTFELDEEDYSLPSGHTSNAFAVATVLSERINNIFASITLYSLAGLTAFQRIYADQHWFSDTVLAAAIGTLVGLKVVKLNSDDNPSDGPEEQNRVNVFPLLNHNSAGIGLALIL